MKCGTVTVKGAGEVGRHQISLEDKNELNPLQLLDSLRSEDCKIEVDEEKGKNNRSLDCSVKCISYPIER